jgi:hypothetical protein
MSDISAFRWRGGKSNAKERKEMNKQTKEGIEKTD